MIKLGVLYALIISGLVLPTHAGAQTTPESVKPVLEEEIQPTAVTAFQVRHFLMKRIAKLPSPTSAQEWTAEEARLREHFLKDIVFHGWPRQWIDSAPVFQPMGTLETDGSYRLRKFRYEIVPGFWSTALLYEPAYLRGKVPAILTVEGHFPPGKAAEWVQKRCINFAKAGILTLNLEWFGYGELFGGQYSHDFGAHLDLVGAHVLGLFYLAMRRGLDYLAGLPEVDPNRLGFTGLSGGGWQTIILGALDPRVKVAVEVAGFQALGSGVFHTGFREVEISAPDLCAGSDYNIFVAMRAPRPTLLIHNSEDRGYRSGLVQPEIYDRVKPFFRLFGKGDELAWHENVDPGTHNYQIDNRQHAYAFFTRYFGMPLIDKEIPSDSEIKSFDELKIGVPSDNLTVLGLARKLAGEIMRPPIPMASEVREQWASGERAKLQSVTRYKPVKVENAWRMDYAKAMGVETLSYRFDFDNELSATGVWMRAIAASDSPITIVLNDSGRKDAGNAVSDRVNRGEQVLALDLIFNGEMRPENPERVGLEPLVDCIGERAIGIEVAQLIGAAHWLAASAGHGRVRLETAGIRSQVIALTAAALQPSLFSEVVTQGGMRSLAYLLDAPVPFRSAMELFCLDFYKYFDLDRLIAMAAPTQVRQIEFREDKK